MERTGNPDNGEPLREVDVAGLLRKAGLRLTRQRVALCQLLFGNGNRHVSAYSLHREAVENDLNVALATVYNTLHALAKAGLLRGLPVDGWKHHFDTDTSMHHHFLLEDSDELIDIPNDQIRVGHLPKPPPGYEIVKVDLVVRLRPFGK